VLLGASGLVYGLNNLLPIRYHLDSEIWGTVSDWMIIFLTLVTAVFLYKTLRSQQRQIKIQKKEIKRNKRDVEFNRLIDAVYRQLEFTRQIHLNRLNEDYGLIRLNEQLATKTNFLGFDTIVGNEKRMASVYNMINNVDTFILLLANDVKLFNGLIYTSNLKNKEINMLTDIVNNNFLNDYKQNIDDLNSVFTTGLSKKEFENILDHGHQLNNALDMGGDKTEHHSQYFSKYENILESLILITGFAMANKTERQIEEYKVKVVYK
jgi:hypothetical protein